MADGTERASDLYAVLGIERSATRDDVRRAYRRLARDVHPDVRPGDREAEEEFKQITYAFQILSNPQRRGLYDEFGHLGLRDGFEPARYRAWRDRARAAGYEGPLESLFRGGGDEELDIGLQDLFDGDVDSFLEQLAHDERHHRARVERARRGVEAEVRLHLLEALSGTEREIHLRGRAGTPSVVRVRIPAGVRDGETLRLRGKAGGARPRDLVLTVRVEPHPWLRREGDDLCFDLPLTPAEAYRGARIPVPTPGGEVLVAVPPGTPSGTKLRLRGKGARRGEATGDLYASVRIVLPPPGDENVARALESVSSVCGEPRARLVL